jgi:hypothetical protein
VKPVGATKAEARGRAARAATVAVYMMIVLLFSVK